MRGWERILFWVTLAAALLGVVLGWDALCVAVVVPCTLLILRYEDRHYRRAASRDRRAGDEPERAWDWPAR